MGEEEAQTYLCIALSSGRGATSAHRAPVDAVGEAACVPEEKVEVRI